MIPARWSVRPHVGAPESRAGGACLAHVPGFVLEVQRQSLRQVGPCLLQGFPWLVTSTSEQPATHQGLSWVMAAVKHTREN